MKTIFRILYLTTFACLVLLVMGACGGGDRGNNGGSLGSGPFGGYSFSPTSSLGCPSDTLTITKLGTYFTTGTKIRFVNQSTNASFDGSADVLNNGTIACGLPANAPAGTYDVEAAGASGTYSSIGIIDLDKTNC